MNPEIPELELHANPYTYTYTDNTDSADKN